MTTTDLRQSATKSNNRMRALHGSAAAWSLVLTLSSFVSSVPCVRRAKADNSAACCCRASSDVASGKLTSCLCACECNMRRE